MRKILSALAALLLSAGVLSAQDTSPFVRRVPLVTAYDFDGEATDDDQVVLVTTVADSKTDYVITANPDTCRVVNTTLVDNNAGANITAGTITVTGTDCWGDALTCTFEYTAGDDTGVKALTLGTGTANTCAFKTVTQVSTGVLTGEGAGDTLKVGYTAGPGYHYPIYGVREVAGGYRWVNPFHSYKGVGPVTVSGTTVASYTASSSALLGLSVGDLVYLTVNGQTFERKVATVVDANGITIDLAIPTAAAPTATERVVYQWKKFYNLVEAQDAWVPLSGALDVMYAYQVSACSATGGCTSTFECSVFGGFATDQFTPNVQIDTANVADTSTGTDYNYVDLRNYPYTHCRAGFKFGTGDTAGTDSISLFLMIREK